MNLEIILQDFIINYGLLSIFILVALEYANFPIPSEVVLPLIGMVGFGYGLNIVEVIIVSTLGGIFGSILNYYLGYYLGDPMVLWIKRKMPKSKKAIKASYHFLQKYDKISVFLSRVVPVARTVISIVAGVIRMNIAAFTIYSAMGIFIWNTLLIGCEYIVSDSLEIIATIMSRYSVVIGILGLILVLIYMYKINQKNKQEQSYRGRDN